MHPLIQFDTNLLHVIPTIFLMTGENEHTHNTATIIAFSWIGLTVGILYEDND